MKEYDGIEHVRKIWILEQVVRTRSLKKAALRAKISPSAVSQAIGALEKTIGKPLVLRGAEGLSPTELAIEMVQTAGPALETLSRLGQIPQGKDQKAITWISFGAYESLALSVFPGLVSRMREKFPEIKLILKVARTAMLATMIRKGELCAAVVTETDNLGRLTIRELGEDRLGFYVSASAPEKSRNLETVSQKNIATIAPGLDGYPRYYQRFIDSNLGTNFKATILSDSFEAIRATVVQGAAIGILPERVARRAPGQLLELVPKGRSSRSDGRHKILLISLPNCDEDEIQLLEDALRPLLEL